MNKSTVFSLAVAIAASVATTAQSGTLIAVTQVPGSVQTIVSGINDKNVVAGTYYTSDGNPHGFFGLLGGTYTTFDYPDAPAGTLAFQIDNAGNITGWSPASGYQYGVAYIRSSNGKFKTVTQDGVPVDGFMNAKLGKKGNFVATYWSSGDGLVHAYMGKKAKYKSDIAIPGATTSTARGETTSQSMIVGGYIDAASVQHGWLLQKGTVTVLDFPQAGETGTVAWDVNDKGLISGYWKDSGANFHGFFRTAKNGKFTEVKVPGAGSVRLLGMNDAGLIAVDSDIGPYIYCLLPKKQCGQRQSQ